MARKGFDLSAASEAQLDLAMAGLAFILVLMLAGFAWQRLANRRKTKSSSPRTVQTRRGRRAARRQATKGATAAGEATSGKKKRKAFLP